MYEKLLLFIFLPLASRTQVEKKPNEKQSITGVLRIHFKDIVNLLSEILTYFNIQPVEDTEERKKQMLTRNLELLISFSS